MDKTFDHVQASLLQRVPQTGPGYHVFSRACAEVVETAAALEQSGLDADSSLGCLCISSCQPRSDFYWDLSFDGLFNALVRWFHPYVVGAGHLPEDGRKV